jgi:hypothetical protein
VLCIVRKKKEREGELVGSAKYLLIVKRSDNAMPNVIQVEEAGYISSKFHKVTAVRMSDGQRAGQNRGC